MLFRIDFSLPLTLPRKCRSPKKWRPRRAITLPRNAGRQKSGDLGVPSPSQEMPVAKKMATGTWRPSRKGKETVLAGSWGILGASWSLWGVSWVVLGDILARLGGILGPLGGVLGRLGNVLGASWEHLWKNIEKNDRGTKVLDSSWDPNWKPKSKKIDVKKRVLYDMSFFSIFTKFSSILAPRNQPNLMQFPFQTQEWPYCENRRFLMRKLQFWQVWRVKSKEKNDQKSIQNFDRKMKWKKMSKTAFFTPKAFQNGVQNPLKLVFKNHVKKCQKMSSGRSRVKSQKGGNFKTTH